MSWNEMKPVKRQSLEQLALTLVLVGKHHHMCWILWLASSSPGTGMLSACHLENVLEQA